MASIKFYFAGKEFEVVFKNIEGLEYGTYKIGAADCDGEAVQIVDGKHILIGRERIRAMDDNLHKIMVELVSV